MSAPSSAKLFERLTAALTSELIAASDEEIAAALHDLGMTPGMKGSAALVDLTWGAWFRAVYGGYSTGVEESSCEDPNDRVKGENADLGSRREN